MGSRMVNSLTLLFVAALAGCAATPQITVVDQQQRGYAMPSIYQVTVATVPLAVVQAACGDLTALACSRWADGRKAFIWLSSDDYAEHEFRHLIFGPKHR